MDPNGYRRALGFPFPAAVLEVADQLLLLRVHGDHGLSHVLECSRPSTDVLELCVALGMLCTLACLLVPLQAVAHLRQEFTDLRRAHRVTVCRQLLCQSSRTFAGPAQ